MTKMKEDITEFFEAEYTREDGSVVKYKMRMPQFGRFPADGNVAITLAEPDVTVSISLSPQTGLLGTPGNYLNYVAIIFSHHKLSHKEVVFAASLAIDILGFPRLEGESDGDDGLDFNLSINYNHMEQTDEDKVAGIFSVGVIYGVPVAQEIMKQNSILDKLANFTGSLRKRMEKANMPEAGDAIH
jgi:hypothetical protein